MNVSWARSGLALILLALGSNALGQPLERAVYKCLHPDGHVEFRSDPLIGLRCMIVERRLGPTRDPASARDGTQATAPVAGTGPTMASDPRSRNCENARKNRNLLESDAPVVTTGPDGQQVVISPEERAAALKTALRDIEYWCEPR